MGADETGEIGLVDSGRKLGFILNAIGSCCWVSNWLLHVRLLQLGRVSGDELDGPAERLMLGLGC